MRFLTRFAMFWYDFVVGDDWMIAAAVLFALLITGLLERSAPAPFWLLPVVVAVSLGFSLWRATQPAQDS
jgi:hypothetical protein